VNTGTSPAHEIKEPLDEHLLMIEVDAKSEKRAQQLHSESIVVDTCNTAVWDQDYIVNRLVPSGVNVIVKTLTSRGAYAETGLQLAQWFSKMHMFSEHLVRGVSYSEIKKAMEEGKVAVIYALQSSQPLDDHLELLDVYYEMGVRVLQLTYNSRINAGDGCLERYDGGLSDWGMKLVEKMNKLGMVVDLSHTSPKTSADAIKASSQPVIFSHSNCRALVDNPRNIDDNLVKAIGKIDGYIGINSFLSMLTKDLNRTPSLDEVIAHVDHVAKTAGHHCVGFGLDRGEGRTLHQYQTSDFPPDSYPTWDQRIKYLVKEIKSVRQFINLTRALVKRGYTDTEIKGILGGNFLRVFKQVVG
jgi:membrane dipeptidase